MSGIRGAQVLLSESSEADLDRLICQLPLRKTMLMQYCLPSQMFTDYHGCQQVESWAQYSTYSFLVPICLTKPFSPLPHEDPIGQKEQLEVTGGNTLFSPLGITFLETWHSSLLVFNYWKG